jgi:hypothetical protein
MLLSAVALDQPTANPRSTVSSPSELGGELFLCIVSILLAKAGDTHL